MRHAGWIELRFPEGRHVQVLIRQPKGCAHTRWLVGKWRARAYEARIGYYRWREEQKKFWLRDFEFCDGCRAWHKAVAEVQRVFPDTESWLLSCSWAEGKWGRWVGYGGQPYSTWLRDSDTVGGPLQFRFSTFTGMYRRALDYVREHGFRVPSHIDSINTDYRGEMTNAWRSALGQALAGGWARYTGNDDSHWRASWGRGC